MLYAQIVEVTIKRTVFMLLDCTTRELNPSGLSALRVGNLILLDCTNRALNPLGLSEIRVGNLIFSSFSTTSVIDISQLQS